MEIVEKVKKTPKCSGASGTFLTCIIVTLHLLYSNMKAQLTSAIKLMCIRKCAAGAFEIDHGEKINFF